MIDSHRFYPCLKPITGFINLTFFFLHFFFSTTLPLNLANPTSHPGLPPRPLHPPHPLRLLHQSPTTPLPGIHLLAKTLPRVKPLLSPEPPPPRSSTRCQPRHRPRRHRGDGTRADPPALPHGPSPARNRDETRPLPPTRSPETPSAHRERDIESSHPGTVELHPQRRIGPPGGRGGCGPVDRGGATTELLRR